MRAGRTPETAAVMPDGIHIRFDESGELRKLRTCGVGDDGSGLRNRRAVLLAMRLDCLDKSGEQRRDLTPLRLIEQRDLGSATPAVVPNGHTVTRAMQRGFNLRRKRLPLRFTAPSR